MGRSSFSSSSSSCCSSIPLCLNCPSTGLLCFFCHCLSGSFKPVIKSTTSHSPALPPTSSCFQNLISMFFCTDLNLNLPISLPHPSKNPTCHDKAATRILLSYSLRWRVPAADSRCHKALGMEVWNLMISRRAVSWRLRSAENFAIKVVRGVVLVAVDGSVGDWIWQRFDLLASRSGGGGCYSRYVVFYQCWLSCVAVKE